MTAPGAALLRGDPSFSDVIPLPLPQLPGDAFCVSYTPSYEDLLGHFLALLSSDEASPRAVAVATRVISEYPSHYTAWWYRFRVLSRIGYDTSAELSFVSRITSAAPKSYQAWHYRQWLVDRAPRDPGGQIEYLRELFSRDAKNFHAWNFALWYGARWGRTADVHSLALSEIARDVRNNSAWNARLSTGASLNLSASAEFDSAAATLRTVARNDAACGFIAALCRRDASLLPRAAAVGRSIGGCAQGLRLQLLSACASGARSDIAALCDALCRADPVRARFYALVADGRIRYE